MILTALVLAAPPPPPPPPPQQQAPTVLPFSEAVRAGDTLYLSGQIGLVPGTRWVVPGGIEAEAHQAMDNIGEVLRRNGLRYRDLVMCHVFLADMADWGAFNKVYVTYFVPGHFPARSALGANGLALGARTEVECLAHFSSAPARRSKKG